MSKSCPFCHWYQQDLLVETPNFCLLADRYPLREGHCLLVPKNHLTCSGAVPGEHRAEFLQLLEDARTRLEKLYGPMILWENGGIFQSVTHAHLHLIPARAGRVFNFPYHYWKNGRIVELSGWEQLFDWYHTNGVYQLFQNGRIEPLHILRPIPELEGKRFTEANLTRLRQIGIWHYISSRLLKRNNTHLRANLRRKWEQDNTPM